MVRVWSGGKLGLLTKFGNDIACDLSLDPTEDFTPGLSSGSTFMCSSRQARDERTDGKAAVIAATLAVVVLHVSRQRDVGG